MSITPYCTESNVQEILSSAGVLLRIDDPDDGTEDAADTAHVAAAIEKASCDVNVYLFQRYSLAQVVASTWVKWVTATIAACNVCRRRGNTIPESIEEDKKSYFEQLAEIRDRKFDLPADDGRQAPVNSDVPTISNFAYVDWYRRTRTRRVPATSTGPLSAPVNGGGKLYTTIDGQNNW